MDLGAVAVVTGASSGIGRAIAAGLARGGATVAALGRDVDTLEKMRIDEDLDRGGFEPFAVDLDSGRGMAEFEATWQERLGRVDVLVHSAGVHHRGLTSATPVEFLEQLLRVNVVRPYALTRMLLAELCRRQGQIVFINSSVVHNPRAQTAQFAASKGALKAYADGLRAEVNGDGVRVLTVHPGRTASPTQEHIFAQEGRPYDAGELLQPSDVADIVIEALELPRTAEVTELRIRPMRKASP
jgi:NADP-dependent 3-hydroxy acid dehydrogenase YdfG